MIIMDNVCKTYKVAKRNAGFKAACSSLFRRDYEYIHALDRVSFTIGDGEMVGYMGPNGAPMLVKHGQKKKVTRI